MLSELKKRWVTVRSKNFQLCVLHNNGLVAVPENLPTFHYGFTQCQLCTGSFYNDCFCGGWVATVWKLDLSPKPPKKPSKKRLI